jgi:hypothetical protein
MGRAKVVFSRDKVHELAASGMTERAIAAQMGLSAETVHRRLLRIARLKLQSAAVVPDMLFQLATGVFGKVATLFRSVPQSLVFCPLCGSRFRAQFAYLSGVLFRCGRILFQQSPLLCATHLELACAIQGPEISFGYWLFY